MSSISGVRAILLAEWVTVDGIVAKAGHGFPAIRGMRVYLEEVA